MSESCVPFHPLLSMLAFWELLSHLLVWRKQKPFHLGGRKKREWRGDEMEMEERGEGEGRGGERV